MSDERITLEMSTQDVLVVMSEGNPGALRVCMETLNKTPDIDPDNVLGGLGVILSLDSLGIYGPRIWMLYKDVCGESLTHMLALLRAYQLGQLEGVTSSNLNQAIDSRGEGINPDAALDAVKERLPNFGIAEASAA